MKIRSIEPTPSPNAMKLNMDESLPEGKNYRFTSKEKEAAPSYLRRLLSIPGVKSVFQVADFISLERHPKADWEVVLTHTRTILGEADDSSLSLGRTTPLSTPEPQTDQDFMEVAVLIQKIKDIPMQIKLIKGEEELRVGLPERFKQAVMEVQAAVSNLIFERKWVEQSPRYGDLKEVGEQVAEEISAAYDETRLQKMVKKALAQEEKIQETSQLEFPQALEQKDWKKRYQALEQLQQPTVEMIPWLEQALKDEKQAIRRLAVVTLGFIEKKEVLPALIQALEDRSAIVRRTAGDTLSDLGYPEAIPAMCKALTDPNKLVRWRAARFLYEVGDDTAIPALQKAVHDSEFEVRMQAQMALERIKSGEAASGTVWQQMTRKIQEDKDQEAAE